MLQKSKFFLFFALTFFSGVLFASFFNSFSLLSLVFVFAFVIYFVFLKDKKLFFWFLVFCLVFSLGFLRYYLSFPEKEFLIENYNKDVTFEAIVINEPYYDGVKQKIVLDSEKFGKILVYLKDLNLYSFKDRVLVSGKLLEPKNFKDFNFKMYLAKDDIYFLMHNPKITFLQKEKLGFLGYLYLLKNKFKDALYSLLPSPHAEFISGVLFGAQPEMPKDTYNDFVKTGVVHILALSGFNVAIIIIFLSKILENIFYNKKILFIFSLVFVLIFVLMTGAQPTIVRAAIMGLLLLFIKFYGGMRNSQNALVFAALSMVVYNPKILVYDLSFQLSVLATFGILKFQHYFENLFKSIPNLFESRYVLATTFSAQITTTPLILYTFNTFSFVSFLTNLLIVPFVPVAMLFGFLAGLSYFFIGFVANLFAYILFLILDYQLKIISFLASFSFSQITL